MKSCRSTKKNNKCGSAPTDIPSQSISCTPFSVCLPFGRKISYNGQCMALSGDPVIEDGWYDKIQVKNGCIVDAATQGVITYTPAPCAPATSDCGDSSGDLSLSGDADNLSYWSGGELLTKIFFDSTTDITVSGAGTNNDPIKLKISSTEDSRTYFQNGSPSVFGMSGEGSSSSPYILTMKKSALGVGTYNGLKIDYYGRVVGYDESKASNYLTNLMAGDGIKVSIDSSVATVGLAKSGVEAKAYQLGGYSVDVDTYGRMTGLLNNIKVTAGAYDLGAYTVTINGAGSITKIEAIEGELDAVPTSFVAQFEADTSSEDVFRMMEIETPYNGMINVEYLGYLGETDGDVPGQLLGLPGITMDIDDEEIADLIFTTVPSVVSGKLAIVGVRGTTTSSETLGTKVVTITGSNAIVMHDGFMKCEIVGRGT